MNKNQKMWGFALLLVLQELWTYQGFFLVGFKLYTSGSWFNYNHWVNVLYLYLCFVSIINVGSRFSTKNMNFSFLGQLFQYYLLGLKACRLRFASFGIRAQVLKSVFYPFYLLFPVIILSCSFCVLYSLFLFCDAH